MSSDLTRAASAAASSQPKCGRARPLPPDERRAALIAATLPLVGEHGTKVTTRQIAEAAGVAEGTIFRVFPDKEALIRAAVAAALDPVPLLDEIKQIDPALPLVDRLTRLTEALQHRQINVINLLSALRSPPRPEPGRATSPHRHPDDPEEHRRRFHSANKKVHATVVRVLEPDRDQFRLPVEEVAQLLRLLTFSGSHPVISDGNLLSPDQIVAVLLDGVRRHQPESS